MSNTIEQRVVEMRFDNSHFAKGVSATLSMLEKLKEKLNFSGATKGLDDINASAKRVDMASLGGAVDTVSAKFSALQVMGVTALANITNSAVNAGKQIVESLTIEPVSDGFKEYELTLNAIQTTMAGTGKTAKEVEVELKKLDEYADKTVYSTADMLNNLPKFTNAGVDLEKATTAMIGIANATALAGGGADKASIAFYNLGQAIGTGYLGRIDFNSINQAGIATMEWKEQMIEAALAQGTLTKAGDDAYIAGKKTYTLQQLFIDGLQEQWATTDVMMQVFGDYGDETTKIGEKAYAAAQDIKTYTQMMESLKATAGTGWKDTWQLLIGDLDQAKSFWTNVTNGISGVITKMADARNELLGDTLTSNWDKFNNNLSNAGVKMDEFGNSLRKVVGAKDFNYLISECGDLENAIKTGAFSSDELKKALDGIAETKADTKIASFVDGLKNIKDTLQRGDVGDDVASLQAALNELGFDLGDAGIDGILGPATQKAIKEFQKLNGIKADGIVGPETIKALEEAGKEVVEISRNVDELKESCDGLFDGITKVSGRELLLGSLKNIVEAITKPLKALGKAWGELFSIESDQLYSALEGLNRFSKALVISDETSEKLTRTFKGLFSIIKIITTIVGGGFKLAFTGLTIFLEQFDMDLLDLIATIGDAITAVSDFISNLVRLGFQTMFSWLIPKLESAGESFKVFRETVTNTITGIINNINSWIESFVSLESFSKISYNLGKAFTSIGKAIGTVTKLIVDNIGKWIKKIEETDTFKACAQWISDAAATISNAIDNVTQKIANFDGSKLSAGLETIGTTLSGIGGSLRGSATFMSAVDLITGAVSKLWAHITSIKFPEINLDNLQLFSKQISSVDEYGVSSFGTLLTSIGTYLKDDVFLYDWGQICNKAFEKFTTFWLSAGDNITKAFKKCEEVATAIKKFIFGTEEVDLPAILAVAERFLKIILAIQILKTLRGITAPFDGIAGALNNLAASFKWKAIGDAFKAMAIALGAFALCIYVIGTMPDMSKAWQAFGMLAGLMILMGGVVTALGWVSSKFDNGLRVTGTIFTILGFVGALVLLIYAIQKLDTIDLKDPVGTFGLLITTLLTLTIGVRAIAAAGGASFKSVAAILTLCLALKEILAVIDSYDQYSWAGKGDAIVKMLGMLGAIALAANIATRGVKSGGVTGLATTIIALVVSLKLLLQVIEEIAEIPEDEMIEGQKRVTRLLGGMALIALALSYANKGMVLEKGQRSVNNFTGLAFALLVVVAAIWVLGKMPIDVLTQGLDAVTTVLSLFALMLMGIGTTCSGLKMGSIITLLLGIGLLIGEIALILWKMEDVPWQQSLGTAGALSAVLLALIAAMKIMSKITVKPTDIIDWIGIFALMTGLVAVLGYILYKMDGLDATRAVSYALGLSLLLLAMSTSLDILASKDNKPATIERWVMGLAELSLVLIMLSLVLHLTSEIEPKNAIGSSIALGILLLAMSATLKILAVHRHKPETISKWTNGLLALSGVVFVLGLVLRMLEGLDAKAAIGHVLALSGLMIAMSVVMAILSVLKFKPADLTAIQGFAGLAIAVGVLALALSAMSGVENAIDNAIALSILAGALSVCMPLLAFAGKIAMSGGLTQSVGALLVVALGLAIIVSYLSDITNVEAARQNAITLGGLAVALSVCMPILAAVGLIAMSGSMVPGVTALIVVAAALGLVVYAISHITNIDTARTNAITLANLAVVLTLCVAVLSVIGLLIPGVIAGVAALVVVAITMCELVDELSKIKNVVTARLNALTMQDLLATMADTISKVSTGGVNSAIAIVAINGFINIVKKLGALATILGAFASSNENVEKFVDSGLDLFTKLATGLGEMISGFGEGLTSKLPEIGENLSDFAEKIGGFIDLIDGINENAVINVERLINAISTLVLSDFVDTFSPGELKDLGTDLSDFGTNADKFITTMCGIDPGAASSMESFCNALSILTETAQDNAWSELWRGTGTFDGFGTAISEFAAGMKDAAKSLDDFTEEDVTNITRGATAGEALAKLNECIPSVGGKWQEWTGDKSLADWGKQITAFADSLVMYSDKVDDKAINTQKIEASAAAAQAIADVNNNIPAFDGELQKITGTKEIDDWGTKIVAFAGSLVAYSDKVSDKTFNAGKITESATAIQALADVNAALPATDGLFQFFAGEKDLDTFGTGLSALADGVVAYAKAAAEIDQAAIDAIKSSGTAIDELKIVAEKIPSSGGAVEWITGHTDLSAFGTGLSKLADGVTTYVSHAEALPDDAADTIKDSGDAIDELVAVVNDVPTVEDNGNSLALRTAMSNLRAVLVDITTMSATEYDFSATETIKTEIGKLVDIFAEIDLDAFSGKVTSLSTSASLVATCASTIASLNGYTYGGVDSLKAALSNLAEVSVDDIITNFTGKTSKLSDAVNSIIKTLADEFSAGADSMSDAATELVNAALTTIEGYVDKFLDVGKLMAANMNKGIGKGRANAELNGAWLASKAVSGAKSKYEDMKSAGKYLGDGLVLGIEAKVDDAYEAGYALGQAAVQGEKDGQNSASPSKDTIKAGKWLGEGLIIGIGKMGRAVYNAGSSMGSGAVKSISKTISRISDIVESDIDAQPTIRPVLDLSNVESGAGYISSLLGSGASVGVMSNIGAISTMMNRRSQNGAESEVVTAINKLRKDLGNVGNTTYQVNGITYDDGSNVSTAVQDLIRAARIERRV